MGFIDAIGKIGSWVANNADKIEKVADTGMKIYNCFSSKNANSSDGTSAYDAQSAKLLQQQMMGEQRLMYLAYQADCKSTGYQGSFEQWQMDSGFSSKYSGMYNMGFGGYYQ